MEDVHVAIDSHRVISHALHYSCALLGRTGIFHGKVDLLRQIECVVLYQETAGGGTDSRARGTRLHE